MKIEILGSGCAKCSNLADNAKKAVQILGIDATVEKVTDMKAIMQYGVMMTPALVIDGQVKAAGKLLSPEDIVSLLKK
jgi:small redox-active disulfide protein 2